MRGWFCVALPLDEKVRRWQVGWGTGTLQLLSEDAGASCEFGARKIEQAQSPAGMQHAPERCGRQQKHPLSSERVPVVSEVRAARSLLNEDPQANL